MSDHLKIKRFGPKGLNLYKVFMSEELQDTVDSNNILGALRMKIGVDEFNLLRNRSSIGKGISSLLLL